MGNSKLACCCKCSCGCLMFLPWFTLVLLSFMSLANHPSFCDPTSPEKAAADARPDVYKEDGSTVWDSVHTGWNKACGDVPANFSALAANYSSETGGRAVVTDDSGFRSNAWSGGMHKVFKVEEVEAVEGFPFGSRVQSVRSVASIFEVNLFFLPTATSEVAGWMLLQYEICAYFQSPDGSLPNIRLYKTTRSPLGVSDPFVQHFIDGTGDLLFKYDAISEGYNDDPPGVGKARFSAQAGPGCGVWSTANHAIPVVAIIIIMTAVLLLYVGLLIFMWRKEVQVRSAKSPDV